MLHCPLFLLLHVCIFLFISFLASASPGDTRPHPGITLLHFSFEGGFHHSVVEGLRVPIVVSQGFILPVQQGVLQQLNL